MEIYVGIEIRSRATASIPKSLIASFIVSQIEAAYHIAGSSCGALSISAINVNIEVQLSLRRYGIAPYY